VKDLQIQYVRRNDLHAPRLLYDVRIALPAAQCTRSGHKSKIVILSVASKDVYPARAGREEPQELESGVVGSRSFLLGAGHGYVPIASQLVGVNAFGFGSEESRIMQVSWSSRNWAGATSIRSCRILMSRKTTHLAGKCRKSVNWDSLLRINLTGCSALTHSALTHMVKAVIFEFIFPVYFPSGDTSLLALRLLFVHASLRRKILPPRPPT
jgi:hypothetical protein